MISKEVTKLAALAIWEISVVKKTGRNPFFKKMGKDAPYATLNDVLAAVKPVLKKHGLFLTQSVGKDTYGHFVQTEIYHPDVDQAILQSSVYLESTDNMQKIGAAITYARRYGLVSLLGIEDEDDDGNAASEKDSKSDSDKESPVIRKAILHGEINGLLSKINEEAVTKAVHQKLSSNPSLEDMENLRTRLLNKLGEKK